MTGKKLTAFLVVCLVAMLIMPLVSSSIVELSLKAPIYKKASLTILKAGGGYTYINSFHAETGKMGEVNLTFETSVPEVDVGVLIRKLDGEKVSYDRFGPYKTTSPIKIDLIGAPVEVAAVNTTAVETANETDAASTAEEASSTATEEADETSEGLFSALTGGAIFGEDGVFSKIPKITYYIIGIIVLAGAIILATAGVMKNKLKRNADSVTIAPREGFGTPEKEAKTSAKHEHVKSPKKSAAALSADSLLQEAEGKLKEVQSEVDKMRRLREAERKLQEDKEELERLKEEL